MDETFLGTSLPVFVGVTVVLFGGAAWMMGQALAETWRPARHNLPYALLLAAAARFLTFALFGSELLAILPYLVTLLVLALLALAAWRIARARQMVTQYPWLYEPSGIFGYREKAVS